MKFLKKLLTILLIIAIIYMLYYIYCKINQKDISLDTSIFLGSSDSIIDLNVSNNNTEINLSTENNSHTFSSTSTYKNNFYYKQLDSNAKIIYEGLEKNIPNLTRTNYKIDFSTKFNTLLNQPSGKNQLSNSFQAAIDAFFYDHPELFYIDLTKMSLYTKSITLVGKTTYTVSIVPENNKNYLYNNFSSEMQLNQAIKKVENIRSSFTNGVSGSNYNKMLQIHDTLVDMMEYDTTYSRTNTHNIYGALIEKKAVCEWYAKAFKYILDSLNIPCILVGGTATNSSGNTESHMWNYVQIDGVWYGVDLTWDDPIVIGGLKKNTISHDYFLKGSLTFNRTHNISNTISENGMKFTYPNLSMYDYKK